MQRSKEGHEVFAANCNMSDNEYAVVRADKRLSEANNEKKNNEEKNNQKKK